MFENFRQMSHHQERWFFIARLGQFQIITILWHLYLIVVAAAEMRTRTRTAIQEQIRAPAPLRNPVRITGRFRNFQEPRRARKNRFGTKSSSGNNNNNRNSLAPFFQQNRPFGSHDFELRRVPNLKNNIHNENSNQLPRFGRQGNPGINTYLIIL